MSKADIDDKSIRLRKTRPSLAPARSRALPRDRVPGATGTNKRPPRSAAVVAALIPSAEPRAHASPLRSRSGIQGSRTAAQPAKGVRFAHAPKPARRPLERLCAMRIEPEARSPQPSREPEHADAPPAGTTTVPRAVTPRAVVAPQRRSGLVARARARNSRAPHHPQPR